MNTGSADRIDTTDGLLWRNAQAGKDALWRSAGMASINNLAMRP